MKKGLLILVGIVLVLLSARALYTWLFLVDSRSDKVWLHRCDSMEKLEEMGCRYPNFEVDVCIRPDGELDVTHDEDTTFGLTIAPYFQYLQVHPDSKMWIDVKNLSRENQAGFIAAIDSLCRNCCVQPQRIIVESPKWQLLQPLTEKGYHTSCYVKADRPSRISREECQTTISELQRVVDSHAVTSLSFPHYWYDEIHEAFADKDINLLTWRNHDTQFGWLYWDFSEKMLHDDQLKVILIKDKGHYHR